MRILLINRNHFLAGGADRVYLNTGKLLEKYGHDVAYFSTVNDENLYSKQSSYFVEKIQTRGGSAYSKIFNVKKYLYNKDVSINLEKLIFDFKPDVAHLHLFYGVLSASVLSVLNKNKVPVVITIHDYRLLCPVNTLLDKNGQICEKCKKSRFYNCVLNRCSQDNFFQSTVVATEAYMRKYFFDPIVHIDHFIFVSHFSRNKHIMFDKRFKEKSTQLYNFTNGVTNITIHKGDYLFYYGRLSREKGILNLINAVKQTNSKLIIAGDGPQKKEILTEINGISNILYVGFKTGSELNELILKCSFVVVPSEWYENNPMTIVESFQFGKPVIGSNIGGIPELINTTTGFVFESANQNSLCNAIIAASEVSNDEYSNLSASCFNFADVHFNEQTHLGVLTGIYKKVIDESNCPNS